MQKSGTCKWFNNEKKYGFITAEDGTEYFVHWSEIQKDGYKGLTPGQRVNFEFEESELGLKAVNVEIRPIPQ